MSLSRRFDLASDLNLFLPFEGYAPVPAHPCKLRRKCKYGPSAPRASIKDVRDTSIDVYHLRQCEQGVRLS